MKSALLTADRQFQRAMEKERGVVEDLEIRCRLAGLRCLSVCETLERGTRDNRNGLETHDRGGRIEDSKGECVREYRNYT